MKSKRQLKQKYGTKRKFQLPSKTEGLMIFIMLSIICFDGGEFLFQSECCEGNQCEIKKCGM